MENQIIMEAQNIPDIIINQVLYTGKVHVEGGRQGYAVSKDGRLDTMLSVPGSEGKGTNPEQLFAAGWAACFMGAMRHHSPNMGIAIPQGASVDAEIDLALDDLGFTLQARFNVTLPGLSLEQATSLIASAHATCPYSRATKGNINVLINAIL